MTDSVESFSQSASPPPPPTRLTLVLPPLKDGKLKSSKKRKSKQAFAYSEYQDGTDPLASQKAPRPVKLKPLKEVIGRLIVQLKKKDDYAFFLKPVNPAQVPGYADLVKRPMDLGTMATKVQRGRYRSLEDFANDFRLVTMNAKIFNPPGSIYYTEAEKLEVWGLDQISKAASTVIQYETDWNIEIEKDDAEDDAEDYPEPAPEMEERSRSPSVGMNGGGHLAMLRRGPRGPYNTKSSKENPTKDIIDAEGRMPGSKDGLGAFPPGSAMARTMLALKLKGKRYKTKKERMRVEKEGPPLRPDGSLDYTEVEDPFTFLSALVPEPPSRPQLIPLYPPPHSVPDASTPAPPAQIYPIPTLLSHPAPLPPLPPKMKHWSLSRNGGVRKPRDELPEDADDTPTREPHALDYGSLALLASELAADMRRRNAALPEAVEEADALVKERVRESVELEENTDPTTEYWGTPNALEAEAYVRDVVYGGVDGLAYVRSLAEFVGTPPLDTAADDSDEDVDMEDTPSVLPLGVPLAAWVEQNVVGPLTEGRHTFLQRTGRELMAPSRSAADNDKVPARVASALHVRPRAAAALAVLLQIHAHKIDMAALIRTPDDLVQSEQEWVGKRTPDGSTALAAEAGPAEMNIVLEYVAGEICRLQQAERDTKVKVEAESAAEETESAVMRNLRLNLLALVKRAPLDTIARLPLDLVPEHIRPFVPTLTSVAGTPAS